MDYFTLWVCFVVFFGGATILAFIAEALVEHRKTLPPRLTRRFLFRCFWINRNQSFSDLESNTLNKYFDEMEAKGYIPKPERKTLQ